MSDLLSNNQAKNDLAAYLSKHIIKTNSVFKERKVFTSYGIASYSNLDGYIEELSIKQEEADTKIILHAQYIAVNVNIFDSSCITVCSPDTDVFLLLLKYCDSLCCCLYFQTGPGTRKRLINVAEVVSQLTVLQKEALPAFHALSGCDVTGGFARKWYSFSNTQMFNHILNFLGKLTFLGAFYKADDKILATLIALGDINTDIKEVSKEWERFICL